MLVSVTKRIWTLPVEYGIMRVLRFFVEYPIRGFSALAQRYEVTFEAENGSERFTNKFLDIVLSRVPVYPSVRA